MRRFGGDKMWALMDKLGLPDDQPIENGIISKSIESAQSKIEGHNFDIRKHVLEYDDVVNKQREVVYGRRRKILKKENIGSDIKEILKTEIENIVTAHTADELEDKWNIKEIREETEIFIGEQPKLEKKLLEIQKSKDHSSSEAKVSAMMDYIFQLLKEEYSQKEQKIGEEIFRKIEKEVYLKTVDQYWMEHLDSLTYLRDSTNLQGYGQRDPLVEYKKQGYQLFQVLLSNINHSIIKTMFRIQPIEKPVAEVQEPQPKLQFSGGDLNQTVQGGQEPKQFEQPKGNLPAGEVKKNSQSQVVNTAKKVGRNDPCPCGSGKKYKKCCGRK